jgi:hypothetical protein
LSSRYTFGVGGARLRALVFLLLSLCLGRIAAPVPGARVVGIERR